MGGWTKTVILKQQQLSLEHSYKHNIAIERLRKGYQNHIFAQVNM